MSKKPFSIRVESYVVNRFKALSTVLNIDGASLLAVLIEDKEKDLTEDQKIAYDALLRVWRDE